MTEHNDFGKHRLRYPTVNDLISKSVFFCKLGLSVNYAEEVESLIRLLRRHASLIVSLHEFLNQIVEIRSH